MNEPTTPTGKRLLQEVIDEGATGPDHGPHPEYVTDCWVCGGIAAIEREAAAAERELRHRATVETFQDFLENGHVSSCPMLDSWADPQECDCDANEFWDCVESRYLDLADPED